MNINTIRLRLALGWLGIDLPWIVVLLSLAYGYKFPASISDTYYVPTCITPFMIILGSASILLIAYSGYDRLDDILCSVAAIFGLFICLFPCGGNATYPVGTFRLPAYISGIIHNISAIIFFGLLAINSFFLFTKSSGEMTTNKRKRNIIYRVCGIGMIASFLLMIPVFLFNIYGGIWFVEMLALTFFGISWLTKSDIYPWLFCDTPYKD